jgi:hypothetical protein
LWNSYLTDRAAEDPARFELLKWLVRCGCPLDLHYTLANLEDYEILGYWKQLRSISEPWPTEELNRLLLDAGACSCQLDVAMWLREQGAQWPKSFCDTAAVMGSLCWPVSCVQWALANGSTWLEWRCQDLAPEHFDCHSVGSEHSDESCNRKYCGKQHAVELFQWAHENGCPCTCSETAVAAAAAVAAI